MTPLWIASDWHLGPRSPAVHGRLALAFLERARAEGVEVILNGDLFDDLFDGAERARAAHPEVAAAIASLAAAGRLRQTRGNHDPDGLDRIVLERPGVGRLLVTHGHAIDPINASPIGRLGDAISRRFGRTALVRGAAWLAEAGARAVAGERMLAVFRGRCLRALRQGGFDAGVFGHVHRAHAVAGDPYVNAGALHDDRLEYAVIDGAGTRIERLQPT